MLVLIERLIDIVTCSVSDLHIWIVNVSSFCIFSTSTLLSSVLPRRLSQNAMLKQATVGNLLGWSRTCSIQRVSAVLLHSFACFASKECAKPSLSVPQSLDHTRVDRNP